MKTPASHAEAERFFDKIADDYQRRSEGEVFNTSSLSFRRRKDIVSGALRETPPGGTVLDYGMGPAVFAPFCSGIGLRFVGIDISPKMVELAREKDIPNTEYQIGDLDSLEKFKETADTVLIIGLIDYLENPADALKKLAACLVPGGRIVISFRNRRSIPCLLRNFCKAIWRTLKPRKADNDPTTAFEAPVLERSYVPGRDLIPVLRSCHLENFKISYLDASPVFFQAPLTKWLWNAGRKLDAFLSCRLLSWMCASGVLIATRPKNIEPPKTDPGVPD